ncbi:MAG: DUF4469 domain-containing protein [Sedimentisphaerales bacterium]|nr:DUF4469 domain-containing protein [Sedimentisphaerales bacterium]
MAIEYALYQNNLKKDTDQYTARVLKTSSANLDTVVDHIVSQGTYLQKPVIIAILMTFITVAERLLAQGTKIKIDGLLEMAPKIQGKFNGCRDKFDPNRHQLNINVNALSQAKKYFRYHAELAKVDTVLPHPAPCHFLDNATGKTNETITPGKLGILKGFKMSFNPNEAEEGLFLIDTVTRQETKVTNIAENKPSQLIFQVPDFEYNSVYIEVRKRFTPNGTLRKDCLPAIFVNTSSQIKILPTKKTSNRSLVSNRKAANEKSLLNYSISENTHQTTFISTENLQTVAR